MVKQKALPELVNELSDRKARLDELMFDEKIARTLGPPCTPLQLAELERVIGNPLEASHRKFYELHNGWSRFAGGAAILSVEDYNSEWVANRLKSLGDLFFEFEPQNPFHRGAIPILLGEDSQDYLVLQPTTKATRMEFASYHLTTVQEAFPDLASFLQDDLNLTLSLIKSEKKGSR